MMFGLDEYDVKQMIRRETAESNRQMERLNQELASLQRHSDVQNGIIHDLNSQVFHLTQILLWFVNGKIEEFPEQSFKELYK